MSNNIQTHFVVKNAEFVKSAVSLAHYPPGNLPEVAFAGRSNVGKSSLINCLLQRRKLVRTSRHPGRTQMINFFKVNNEFYFVDLPGYGFAAVPESVRKQWGPMVETYITKRESLRGIVLIMDIRHTPTPDDLQLVNWLVSRGILIVPVLTKADKIGRSKWNAQLKEAARYLNLPPEEFSIFSAESREGREKLLERLLELLGKGTL